VLKPLGAATQIVRHDSAAELAPRRCFCLQAIAPPGMVRLLTALSLIVDTDGQAASAKCRQKEGPGTVRPPALACAQAPGTTCAQAPGTTLTVADVVPAKGPRTTSTVIVCSPGGSGRSIATYPAVTNVVSWGATPKMFPSGSCAVP
jgi:hypothetical protein